MYSKVTLVILVIAIFLLFKAVFGVYIKQDMAKDNLAKTAAVYNGLQDRREMLSSEIERLKTEAGKEEEIREKFGLVKEGEEVIIVVDDPDKVQSPSSSPISFWQKVLDWLK